MTETMLAGDTAAAALYSVGHGGTSAYIVLLTLAGRLRAEVAATMPLLNVFVSGMSCLDSARAAISTRPWQKPYWRSRHPPPSSAA